jgi:molybdate transport system regulatory protein
VRATGSIAAAARAMGMDYKRAWLLVDSLNRPSRRPWSSGSPAARAGVGQP